jgi:hypothetical protein
LTRDKRRDFRGPKTANSLYISLLAGNSAEKS